MTILICANICVWFRQWVVEIIYGCCTWQDDRLGDRPRQIISQIDIIVSVEFTRLFLFQARYDQIVLLETRCRDKVVPVLHASCISKHSSCVQAETLFYSPLDVTALLNDAQRRRRKLNKLNSRSLTMPRGIRKITFFSHLRHAVKAANCHLQKRRNNPEMSAG